MKVKISHFNLIEIVLTVAVIAFGVVVVLGMLPKGLQAAKNAGIESFATDVIDQMCNYLTYHTGGNNLPSGYDTSLNIADYDDLDHVALLNGSSDGFQQVNIYGLAPHSSVNGLYAIVRGESRTVNSVTENSIDFSGMLYVWQSPAYHSRLEANHSGSDSGIMHDCGKEHCSFSRDRIQSVRTVQINMELSYPLSLPYSERAKRYYSFEVQR